MPSSGTNRAGALQFQIGRVIVGVSSSVEFGICDVISSLSISFWECVESPCFRMHSFSLSDEGLQTVGIFITRLEEHLMRREPWMA